MTVISIIHDNYAILVQIMAFLSGCLLGLTMMLVHRDQKELVHQPRAPFHSCLLKYSTHMYRCGSRTDVEIATSPTHPYVCLVDAVMRATWLLLPSRTPVRGKNHTASHETCTENVLQYDDYRSFWLHALTWCYQLHRCLLLLLDSARNFPIPSDILLLWVVAIHEPVSPRAYSHSSILSNCVFIQSRTTALSVHNVECNR